MKSHDPNNWPEPISRYETPFDTAVKVRRDDGAVFETRTRSKPWKLGKRSWVVCVVGIAGAVKLGRVALVGEK